LPKRQTFWLQKGKAMSKGQFLRDKKQHFEINPKNGPSAKQSGRRCSPPLLDKKI
jgi:hypothetical protein